MNRRTLALSLFLFIWTLAAACGGPVTEEDLQRWTNNDKGLERIGEVVADPKHPVETRIRALEVVVEKRLVTRLRTLMDKIEHDREAIVSGLIDELKEHLATPEDEVQLDAKDGLLLLKRYAKVEEVDGIQKAIADWAFQGLTMETPEKEVTEQISQKISSGQIKDLGKYAYKTSAILIANGLAVDEMLDLLASADDKERASELAVAGLRRLHKVLSVQDHHIKALRKLPSKASILFLLELYKRAEEDYIRAMAYNFSLELICPKVCANDKKAAKDEASCAACCEKAKTTESFIHANYGTCQCEWDRKSADFSPCRPNAFVTRAADPIADGLLASMKEAQSLGDLVLWSLARLRLTGAGSLVNSLELFPDNAELFGSDFDTQVTNFCNYIEGDNFSAQTRPVFEQQLRAKSRLTQAISVICLKVTRSHESRGALHAMAAELMGAGTLEKIKEGTYEKAIMKAMAQAKPDEVVKARDDLAMNDYIADDSFKAPMTLGKLALNAAHGLDLLETANADFEAKKFDAAEYRQRVDLITNTHTLYGPAFGTYVDELIQAWKKQRAEESAKQAAEEAAEKAPPSPEAGSAKEKAPAPATP